MKNVVLITGGDRGIGKAITLRFAKEKYSIIITYNNNIEAAKETLIKALEAGAPEAVSIKMDLSSYEDIIKAKREVEKKFTYINVIINNAGIIGYTPFEELSIDEWKRIIDVDLTGPFLVIKEFFNLMKNAPWASIVNISSIAGQTGNVIANVAYSAAKAGLIGFTKKLAIELAKYNIRVNAVAPSVVETDMTKNLLADENKRETIKEMHPLKIILKPVDIAETVYFLASPNLSRGITGQIISINAGRYT